MIASSLIANLVDISRIWDEENPRKYSVIGPYFFQNEAGDTATVNGFRYRTIRDYLENELEDTDIENMWLQ